jgi:heme/copper-type cytochrome/quinol oxidase subunit 3
MILAGEWKNPFHFSEKGQKSVSEKFQFWQFIVTASVLIFNLLFSFYFQKQTAVQNSKNTLKRTAKQSENS